jgi:hypothetical protein
MLLAKTLKTETSHLIYFFLKLVEMFKKIQPDFYSDCHMEHINAFCE